MTMENIDNRIDIKSMTIEELEELLVSMGDKKFRGKQIFSWLHEKLVVSFDDMTNLSKNREEEHPWTTFRPSSGSSCFWLSPRWRGSPWD